MGTNPKLRGLGHAGKIPKGTHGQDLHPGETEPKYLRGKMGSSLLSCREPNERGQENSTRAEVASAAALRVHRGGQHLLLRELPSSHEVLETLQSTEPRVPAAGRVGRQALLSGEEKF